MKLNKNCILLFLFCLLVYGVFSDLIPLLDPDEPVYGETAKEMLATGDWISPRIYGEFWYDKPPLFYWLEAISFSLFGVSTWSARFPSVILAAITPVYLYLSTRKLIGEKAALRGAFICATSLEIIVLARSAVTDTALTLALTVALISFLRKEYLPAYIACGVALLAKGPIGFGFPALIVGLWMLLNKQFTWRPIMGLQWYWGIPLACLVGLPWYIAMASIHGDPFINTFLGYHNVTRFISPEHAGQNHYWLYLVVLIAGFYPWSGTLPGVIRRFASWRKDRNLSFFMVWFLFILIFFSCSSTQLFSYVLPMFPPLSLLAGMYLTELETDGHISYTLMGFHVFFATVTAIALVLAPLTPLGGAWVKYGIAGIMILSAIFSLWQIKRGHMRGFLFSQALLILVFVLSVWGLFAPSVSSLFTSASIAKELQMTERKTTIPLYIDTFYRPSVAFYTDIYGEALPELDVRKKAENEKNKQDGVLLPGKSEEEPLPDNAYVLVQKKIYKKWPEALRSRSEILWEKDTAYFLQVRQGSEVR